MYCTLRRRVARDINHWILHLNVHIMKVEGRANYREDRRSDKPGKYGGKGYPFGYAVHERQGLKLNINSMGITGRANFGAYRRSKCPS